jgi:cell shape-determining protein MreD
MLWRFAHPVGVVMLSSVAATAVLEAIATGLGFSYGSKELALLSISSHLIPALVINTILATLLFFALRKRRA